MTTNFIHLTCHSEFSIVDGLCQLGPLVEQVKAQGQCAVGVTDHMNLFAAVKFYRAATKAGIKPIFGACITIDAKTPYTANLLCQDQAGWRNLSLLLSKAYRENNSPEGPRILPSWLETYNTGLIFLSQQLEQAAHWVAVFGDRFYLELASPNPDLINQAYQLDVPTVASNQVRFISHDDFLAHEARVCIHAGYTLDDPSRPKNYTPEQYLKTPTEMADVFKGYEQALENTLYLAQRCNVKLSLDKVYLPNFPVPAGLTIEMYFQQQAEAGLKERLKYINQNPEPYFERLALELAVISRMGYPGYFLIVADFIQWAKDHDIPVGPGRGSGAGSLVAYALKITDLDPLEFDLLFERFLNPERVSMPDFDVDFCMEGRDRVIDYVTEKYGRDSVSQIITFGTMAAKAVVRDVGRVLGQPYGFVDKLAKLIPFELGITLDKAINQEEDLRKRYESEEEVTHLIDLAKKLEGIARNAGKHAGGVVIAPSNLTDFVPLYCEQGAGQIVTQLDKDDVEAIGLVKFDFLGLRTLTIIHWALKIINQNIDITLIPTNDKKTFDLLKACQTTAVFQLESRGMKDLIHRLEPDCFEEIIALVALFRPGPLQSGMVDDFIDRKHGRSKVEYLHPALKDILEPTYGVILYQEQVMQIAQELAGYTLGAADLLRRAMGKKKPEEMAKQRNIFITGAQQNNIDPNIASKIFDLMEKFAGYGFNKSHSAAYALIAYQTAWLKAHYPAAFMAAVLSSDMDNTDKIIIFMRECYDLGITVLPPDVNQSEFKFTVVDDKTLRYGLGAIKGLGESAIEHIIMRKNQGYKDLFDFTARVDTRKVNRRAFEAMIRAGALDQLGPNRTSVLYSLESALKAAERKQSDQLVGQFDLFSDITEPGFIQRPEMDLLDMLKGEKDALGFYLSGHPFSAYQKLLAPIITARIGQLNLSMTKATTAGLLTSVRKLLTKRGDRMAIITLEDGPDRLDIALFSNEFEEYKTHLILDEILIIEGEVSHDDYTGGIRLRANKVYDLPTAQTRFARRLSLHLPKTITPTQIQTLQHTLKPHTPGRIPVEFYLATDQAQTQWQAGGEWRVTLSTDLISELEQQLTKAGVELVYE